MTPKALRVGLLVPLFVLTFAPPAAPQSAAAVIESAMAQFEERAAGIENYTVIQDVNGFEVTNYFEKRMIDGRPTFVLVGGHGADEEGEGEFYHGFMKVADRATLGGIETIDGHRCHVVQVDDLSGIDFDPNATADEEDFKPRSGRFFLDSSDYFVRKLHLEGEFEREGQMRPVTMEMVNDMRDGDADG